MTRKQIESLPDSHFLYAENGVRRFPYKNIDGNVDKDQLLHSLVQITQESNEIYRPVVRKARMIAVDAGINLSESFLDDSELKFPAFQPYLEGTLHAFNLADGYTQFEYDMMGKKLARILNQSTTKQTSEINFTDAGEEYNYSSKTRSVDRYEYEDGSVLVVKGADSHSHQEEKSAIDVEVENSVEDNILVTDGEPIPVIDEESTPATYETVEVKQHPDFGNKEVIQLRAHGTITICESKGREDGTVSFKVPLFKIGQYTANGNRYMEAYAKNIISKIGKLRESARSGDSSRKSALDLHLESSPDMLATHDGRMGGNPILTRAGIVTGGEIGEVEGDPTFFIMGETIPTTAGKDVSIQLQRGMIKGVSAVTIPTKYEKNGKNGADVFDGHFLGADFEDDPANAVQFKSQPPFQLPA